MHSPHHLPPAVHSNGQHSAAHSESKALLSNGVEAKADIMFSEVPWRDQRPLSTAAAVLLVSSAMAIASNYMERATSTNAAATYASENQPDVPEINDVNNLWLLISTALVMLMTPALSLYYGGMVVDGSVLNRMVRTFVSLGIVGVQWLAIGYSLSFAPSNPNAFNLIGDFSFIAMRNVGSSAAGVPAIADGFGVSHLIFMSFQLMFASITTTILSGAIAEYMSFRAFCLFILLWTTVVYDPMCHAIWGGGLMGWHLDFAGGTVVHLLSGLAATVSATYLRSVAKDPATIQAAKYTAEALDPAQPLAIYKKCKIERRESFDKALAAVHSGTATEHETDWDRGLGGATVAHSATYVVLGATCALRPLHSYCTPLPLATPPMPMLILHYDLLLLPSPPDPCLNCDCVCSRRLIWFGWFGFNGGSAIAPNELAALAVANTNFAAGFAMVTWMMFEYMTGGNPSAVGGATGVVCGLVAITPCAGYVPILASGPIGIIGATSSFVFVWVEQYLGVMDFMDNPMDVFATHGVSSLMGSLCTGIFAYGPTNPGEARLAKSGLLYGGDWELLYANMVALSIAMVYCTVMTLACLWLLKLVLRADGLLSASLFFSEHVKNKVK